jgi:hypothetical protein
MQLVPESTDLVYWNGRFFLWCLSRRPAWAMSKDLRVWPKQIRPTAQA